MWTQRYKLRLRILTLPIDRRVLRHKKLGSCLASAKKLSQWRDRAGIFTGFTFKI